MRITGIGIEIRIFFFEMTEGVFKVDRGRRDARSLKLSE